MATAADNQEPTTETILHKTSSESEPDKPHETVLKQYEAENLKDHIEGEDDNIDKLTSIGEKLRSSPSEVNATVEIRDNTEDSESIDGKETEDQISKSLGVKEKEELSKGSEETKIEDHHVEERELNSLQSDYLSEPRKEEAEAVISSSVIKEIASLDGQSEKEKARNTEINLPESPKEARKDETTDASSTEEKPPFDEKNVSAADLEDKIHLYDMAKGQQHELPVVHETEVEGAQLPVENPKVMHDIDEADRKLDSSDLGMALTEGASDMDLAPPCQIDVNNLETESNVDSTKELEIIGTKTEVEKQNGDSLVESHNLSIGNDDNCKVTKEEEEEFDSTIETHSDEKIDELSIQESEHEKYPQMEGKAEATDLRDREKSDMNDNINQNSKSEEHKETATLDEKAEEIYSAITDKQHTNQSFSATLTTEESKETVYKASETEDTEHISESLEGKEIQGQLLEGSVGTETEGHASKSSEGKETEGCDTNSSDGKETQNHYAEKGEWKSPQEIQTNSEEMIGEMYKEPNGEKAPEGCDATEISESLDGKETECQVSTSLGVKETEGQLPKNLDERKIQGHHVEKGEFNSSQEIQHITEETVGDGYRQPNGGTAQEDEVHGPEQAEEHKAENLSKANITLDGTETIKSVEPETFKDHISPTFPEEEPFLTISSCIAEKELHMASVSEDEQSNLEEIGARGDMEKITNNEEVEIYMYDTAKGQQNPPPLDHETEASEGTQLSVEEPEVMHDIDEADRNLDSNDLALPVPLTEGASDMDLAPPCQIYADNLEMESNMDSKKESGILETNPEDSDVESHNLSITNDENGKVTKEEEEEFDSARATLSDEKIDELNVQESEHKKYTQMEAGYEATDLQDGKEIDMNDNINQNSKPEEHDVIATLDTKGEEIHSDITDEKHTTQSYSATLTTEESKETVDKATETEDTEQVSESLEGKEIQGKVLEGSGGKETEGNSSESSEGKETEGCDTNSSVGKETQNHHEEKGEWKSPQEIQTITEEMIGEMYKEPNGGIAPDGTDIDIPAANSHQSEEVEESELTGENHVENMTKAVTLDNTEKNTGVQLMTFVDHSSVEENSSHAISSSMGKRELYSLSASEDLLVNLADTESRTVEVEIINHEKIDNGTPVDVTLESNHLSNTSSSEDVSSFGVKGISLLDEQTGTEEKARNTEINLSKVPTEAGEDEIIDASSTQESQPIDAKNILVDALKEEDGTNEHDTTKREPDVPSLVHETEVCEENQVSAEEPEETHDVEEAGRMSHSSNLGLTPIEVASDMDMTHHCQIDAAETKIDSTKELQIIAESNTEDTLQENDTDAIKAETNFNSSSTISTANITNKLNIQETEYREDFHMKDKSEVKGDLGDGKKSDTNNDNNQNSELQGYGETDRFVDNEEIFNITDKEESSQIYPGTQTTEELKKTNDDEAAKECKNTFNSPNKDDGTEDEASVSIREKDLLDEVIEASIEEDEENRSQIKEEHQAIESTKFAEDKANTEDLYGEDEGKEENAVVSQVPEDIEKNDYIIQAPEETKEDGTFKEVHSASEPDTPSHDEVKDIGLASLQSIDTIDSNDKADEKPVLTAENPKTEEESSITKVPEEMKAGKEEVQDMKSISLQKIEINDSDEKPEEGIIQLAENSNTEQEASTTQVAQETTGDEELVQHISSISLQSIGTVDLDEKSEKRDVQLAENSIADQESSRIEVLKETTEGKESIDMTNMTTEELEEASSLNFIKEADHCNDKADVLLKKESSLEDVHIDEKTFQVYSTHMENEIPSRINSSSMKDEQVEIKHPEQSSDSVYQTEPSETKEIISERIMMEKPNQSEGGTEMESKYSVNPLSESIETPNEQDDNADKSQQSRKGKEEIYGMIHGNNDDVEVGDITSIQKKEEEKEKEEEEEEEATNELQEKCVVQPMEENGNETIHADRIAMGVSSVTHSEEDRLLDNNSNTLELRLLSVDGMRDQSTMEEENIYEEKSEETGEEMSSADHNYLTSDNSMNDVDNATVVMEELQESKEATASKSDMSPGEIESETKLYHAEVPNETQTGEIKEEFLEAELGVENIPKEEMTETGSTEANISREEIKEEGSSDLKRDSIPEEMSETTKKENNNEKVPEYDIDIIQSEKDRRDDEYEKSPKSNSQGRERSIADDFPLTDIPGSVKSGETEELLAEGHTPAEGSSSETSEEIMRKSIYEDTNEKNEDQVTFEADTSEVMINEAIAQHSTPDGDHSKIPDPYLEKLENDCIDTKEVQVLRDIEMMPESINTTAQTETLKHQTTDDSNEVPGATNSDPELKYTSEESKTIEQEATTTRPVNDPTLDLTERPTDIGLSAADKGVSLAQISEAHDDHVIADEAEKEDPLEHKHMISSKDKDIPLLESVSTTVTDIKEVKQVYPYEAVPEPNSTGCSEKEASYDHGDTAGSPMSTSDLGHGFAEENIHEPGDTDSQDQHDNLVVQHVQESTEGYHEGSIDDFESTNQTAELTLAALSKTESLPTPEVDQLTVSSPNDPKDDAQMQEKIAAEDIKVRRETLECAESSFEESKGGGNRKTDEPEETAEKLLSSEMSGESTHEKVDHSGENNKRKTQPAAREVKPEDAKVEKEEHTEQKEDNSGSGIIFNDEKGSDNNTNKIIEEEVDMSSTIYSNELISVQVVPEERTEILINREGIEQKSDETIAEREEQEVWKGEKIVFEAPPMSEKDANGHTIDGSIAAEMITPDDSILVPESPEDHREKFVYSEDEEIKAYQDEAAKEEQEVLKEINPGAEITPTGEKDSDYNTSNKITVVEMKDESPSVETDFRTYVHEHPETDGAAVETGDRDVQKEEKSDTEVAVLGNKDCEDIRVSVEDNTEDLREETVTHRDDKGVDPYSTSGVTDAEIEKLISVNTSEAVAESERLKSSEEKMSSNYYQENQEALESSLSSKIPQTNQGSPEETKLNAAKIESPKPESLHALTHITGLSTETIVKADDSDFDISWKIEEKQEIPSLAAEKFMVVEADLKVAEEPENEKNILQMQQKEDAKKIRAELESTPENSNNEKTTTNETREGNNLPYDKETQDVEQSSKEHFSEANLDEEQAKNTGTKTDSGAVRNLEDKDKEDEVIEHEEDNNGSDLRMRTEASRDTEVKVPPKKSHNLFSGVIKHSISKMKKAITCTNSHPMPQSPR